MSGALAEVLRRTLDETSCSVRSTTGERLDPAAFGDLAALTAARLRDRGLNRDEPVLASIRNRPADLAVLFGIWLAGGVAVPIHADAVRTTVESLRGATGARFSLDGAEVLEIAPAPPPPRPLLNGAALIIFTSGSTGKPKGVVIGHEPFRGKLDVLDRLLRLQPADAVLVPLQLTFIFGLWTSLLAHRSGANLVLVPRFSAEAVAGALAEGGTVLAVVPSMLRTMLSGARCSAPSLRMILTGGEALGTALAGTLHAAFPAAGIVDLYGSTETGSCDFCKGPADQPAGLGSIGSPTSAVACRLGEESSPAMPGSGELQIRTPFGMLGYLDNPELTRTSFADGYFKTGDIARRRADGRIELVGRSKEIISRGGNKIAPLEIDNLLASHPDVAAALCAGVPDERLGEAIHAVVVVKPGASLTSETLRDWASGRIERFKLPDVIHFDDALPVGQTGKASRSALIELAARRRP